MDLLLAACHLQTLSAPRRVELVDVYDALDRDCEVARIAAAKRRAPLWSHRRASVLEALRDRALEDAVVYHAGFTADPATRALAYIMTHNRRRWPGGPAFRAEAVKRALEQPNHSAVYFEDCRFDLRVGGGDCAEELSSRTVQQQKMRVEAA